MRIAYLTNQYPATSHTFIRREIAALEARGHSVLRFALRRAPERFEDAEDVAELDRTRHVLALSPLALGSQALAGAGGRPLRTLRALGSAWRFSRRSRRGALHHAAYLAEALVLARWCRRERVEHIHVHFGTNPATVGALVAELTGIPFSFTVHGPEEFDRAEEHSLDEKIGRAAFVAAVSSFGRSQLMRWARFGDWSKICVVRCGLDQAYRDTPPVAAGTGRTLLCVGRLSEQKGHFVLLKAAALLRRRGVAFDLVLVGDGPMRGVIEREIAALGLGDTVRIAGWMSQPAVRAAIDGSRAMVLPSFAEGLPVVLMESMARARPVISTFVAGIPELVNGENGWLIPAGDPTALAQAMEEALTADTQTLQRVGALARERALAAHDIRESARLIEQRIIQAQAVPAPHGPVVQILAEEGAS
ncbi:MAG: colanic acid biosynthesis glycosyltransferase WcaL [Mesorhizobium amorphae]|nr:MAG: colanic acid biosynthesis glycosyltransferase WcaL [Mesorhizobium amorphae]